MEKIIMATKKGKKKLSLSKLLVLLIVSLVISVGIKFIRMTYNTAEKDFLLLSEILKEQTKGIDNYADRLRVMTDWLHKNVKHGKYPPDFNGKGVANVIRGGVGNCGFQACNIACFAELLGLKEHRIIHNRKEWGAPDIHTFAEVNVDGKWIIYDPDNWQYLKNKKGELVGIREVVKDTSSINNIRAAKWIYSSIMNKGYKITPSWQETPMPYGDEAYKDYEKYGMFYIYKKKLTMDMKNVLFIAFLIGSIGYVSLSYLEKRKRN